MKEVNIQTQIYVGQFELNSEGNLCIGIESHICECLTNTIRLIIYELENMKMDPELNYTLIFITLQKINRFVNLRKVQAK